MSRWSEAFSALTLRGRSFIAAGLTAIACGILLGERDLTRIGVLVALLPVVTAAWTARSGHRLGLVRTPASRRIEVGQDSHVDLAVTNIGATTGTLLVEEQVAWALGPRPRFVLDTMRTGWRRQVRYPISGGHRGRHRIGPLRVRVGDPFGFVELHRSFTRTTEIVVVPQVEQLPAISLHGTWSGTGDNRPRPFVSGGTADVTVREYRRGDDLRRIHWRSTARTGDLMVRREEEPWQSRCTLLVDNRVRAHRGHGPASSLERAVSIAASIGVHLVNHGFQVRLAGAHGDDSDLSWHDAGGDRPETVLDRLAVLPPTESPRLHTDWTDDSVATGMVVAVLGDVDDHDLALLSRLHHQGSASYAVVLDVADWGGGTAAGRSAAGWLQQRGWKATTLRRTDALSTAWQELGR